jgi:hypothetical protein
VIVTQWQGRDLGVNVQQNIAINIDNVISYALVVVGEVDDSVGKLDSVEFADHFLGFGTRNGSLDTWA